MPIAFNVNWTEIKNRRQQAANRDNMRENANRIDYPYEIGDLVYVDYNNERASKHADKSDGPHTILSIDQTNGTAIVDKGGYTENINIRRLHPYKP